MKKETRKPCSKCNGRSFMNGFCLTCDHVKANAANRTPKEASLVDHVEASLNKGFS